MPAADCVDCPLLARCQMRVLKKTAGRRLYFTMAEVSLARRRQRMKLERESGRNLRSAVEATVREISCRLGHGRLHVRGKFRVGMTMAASAAMANARRIWRYQQAERMVGQRRLGTQNEQKTGMFMKTVSLFSLVGRIRGQMRLFAPPSAFFTYSLNLQTVF
ncbi:MAG: transposase [Anaerolineae bacterium]